MSTVSRAQLTKLEGLFQAMDIGGDAGVIFCSDVLNTVDVVKSPFTDHVFEMIGESREKQVFRRWGRERGVSHFILMSPHPSSEGLHNVDVPIYPSLPPVRYASCALVSSMRPALLQVVGLCRVEVR